MSGIATSCSNTHTHTHACMHAHTRLPTPMHSTALWYLWPVLMTFFMSLPIALFIYSNHPTPSSTNSTVLHYPPLHINAHAYTHTHKEKYGQEGLKRLVDGRNLTNSPVPRKDYYSTLGALYTCTQQRSPDTSCTLQTGSRSTQTTRQNTILVVCRGWPVYAK